MTRDEHLMVIAMEECSEVAQRLSKALRFGMEEVQPVETGGDGTINNRDRIWYEWCHLVAMMRMIGIPCASIGEMNIKREKVEHFLAYSASCGTLSSSPAGETWMAEKLVISQRDARLMLGALYRAENWTSSLIAGLKHGTDPSDLREVATEREARRRYLLLTKRLKRKLESAR